MRVLWKVANFGLDETGRTFTRLFLKRPDRNLVYEYIFTAKKINKVRRPKFQSRPSAIGKCRYWTVRFRQPSGRTIDRTAVPGPHKNSNISHAHIHGVLNKCGVPARIGHFVNSVFPPEENVCGKSRSFPRSGFAAWTRYDANKLISDVKYDI